MGDTTTSKPEDKPLLDFDNPKVLFPFVGAAFGLLLIVIVALWCACCPGRRRRRNRRRQQDNKTVIMPVVVSPDGSSTVFTIDRRQVQPAPKARRQGRREVKRRSVKLSALEKTRKVDVNKYVEFEVPAPQTSPSADVMAVDPKLEEMAKYVTRKVTNMLQSITIEPERITKQRQIGSGRFGVVHKGILTSVDKKENREVALKTLAGDMQSDQDMEQFVDEIIKMANFKHPNVMQILGLTVMDGKLHIILPYMEKGDLKTYISSNKKKFNVNDLLKMALQVTRGMDYLGKQNLIHGDLAARNCMVNKHLVVKVADFGLSRHLYQSEYYRTKAPGDCLRPIRWLAIECITENKYSIKSDVWSFGILLWELMTRGERPYYEIASNSEVISRIKNGYRLSCPKYCADEIYEIMVKCWCEDPNNRPNFIDIGKMIESIIGTADEEYLVPNTERL